MRRLCSGLGSERCWQGEILVIHIYGDEVGGVLFHRARIVVTRGRDEDHTARVSSLSNEKPLMVVKVCVDIVWEIIREDCGDSRGSVVRKGETPLCRSRCGSVREGTFGTENGDVSHGWSSDVHRGSEVFMSRGGNEDIIGVNGDVFMKRGEEESVEDFLSYLGGCGRHRR